MVFSVSSIFKGYTKKTLAKSGLSGYKMEVLVRNGLNKLSTQLQLQKLSTSNFCSTVKYFQYLKYLIFLKKLIHSREMWEPLLQQDFKNFKVHYRNLEILYFVLPYITDVDVNCNTKISILGP